jgi:hypothetical protein
MDCVALLLVWIVSLLLSELYFYCSTGDPTVLFSKIIMTTNGLRCTSTGLNCISTAVWVVFLSAAVWVVLLSTVAWVVFLSTAVRVVFLSTAVWVAIVNRVISRPLESRFPYYNFSGSYNNYYYGSLSLESSLVTAVVRIIFSLPRLHHDGSRSVVAHSDGNAIQTLGLLSRHRYCRLECDSRSHVVATILYLPAKI